MAPLRLHPLRNPGFGLLGLFGLAGLALVALLMFATHHLLGSAAPDAEGQPDARAMAAVEGVYRDTHLTLRLRYTPPYLWARSGEGRWERLAPTGRTTLRGTVLGYELDITEAIFSPRLPHVTVTIAGATRKLALAVLPMVGGVPATPYLRGSMNDWGTALALASIGAGQYAAETRLSAGAHEFKIGSADWHQIDLGGNGDPAPVPFGQRLPLYAVGSNIHLNARTAGTYRFVLDLRDPRRAMVTVTPAP